MKKIIVVVVAGLVFITPARAQMNGDPEALKLAEKLVEGIGGRDVWANMRSLYIREEARDPDYGSGLKGELWRDLEVPQERYWFKNENVEYGKGWTGEGGWRYRGGEITLISKREILENEAQYWRGEIYIMYHRLAKEDPTLWLESSENPKKFSIYEDEGKTKLGDFWINSEGELYRWRHAMGTHFVYGPYESFGPVNLPAWGSQVDGSWSFSYVEVRGFETPPPVNFDAPEVD